MCSHDPDAQVFLNQAARHKSVCFDLGDGFESLQLALLSKFQHLVGRRCHNHLHCCATMCAATHLSHHKLPILLADSNLHIGAVLHNLAAQIHGQAAQKCWIADQGRDSHTVE